MHFKIVPVLRLLVAMLLAGLNLNAHGFTNGSFSTAHGLVLGKGNVYYNGAHVQDAVLFKLKQKIVSGLVYETVSGSINTALNSKTIQDGNGDFAVGFKKNGYSLGANLGLSYATIIYNKQSGKIIYNKQSGKEKSIKKSASQISPSWGLSLSKATVFSLDSSWEWSIGATYDEIQNQFQTTGGSTYLQKTCGDFDLTGSLSAYHQKQIDSVTTSFNGYAITSNLDWTGDVNLISLTLGFDLQASTSLQSKIISGIAYTYSPWAWLDLNLMASGELNLDAVQNAKLWLLGSSVRINL